MSRTRILSAIGLVGLSLVIIGCPKKAPEAPPPPPPPPVTVAPPTEVPPPPPPVVDETPDLRATADGRFLRARVFEAQGRVEDALDEARAALEIDPEHVEARWMVVRLGGGSGPG